MTDYLADDLAAALTTDGYLDVTPQLQVRGFDRVYALGDLAAIDANKAAVAARQAEVVAANIKAQINGSAELSAYTPGPTAIVLPLGPERGASQLPGHDGIATGELTAQIKGRDMLTTGTPTCCTSRLTSGPPAIRQGLRPRRRSAAFRRRP